LKPKSSLLSKISIVFEAEAPKITSIGAEIFWCV